MLISPWAFGQICITSDHFSGPGRALGRVGVCLCVRTKTLNEMTQPDVDVACWSILTIYELEGHRLTSWSPNAKCRLRGEPSQP